MLSADLLEGIEQLGQRDVETACDCLYGDEPWLMGPPLESVDHRAVKARPLREAVLCDAFAFAQLANPRAEGDSERLLVEVPWHAGHSRG